MSEFEILYDDPSFFAINKPSGILTQSTFGVPSVLSLLRESHTPAPSGADVAASTFFEVPHRLDRGTSGVLLVAKTRRALSSLSQQFHHRRIEKSYAALCEGQFLESTQIIDDHVRKIPDMAKTEIVAANEKDAKHAQLAFEVIMQCESFAMLKIVMSTGRMHQIRIQLASRGHAVLGDALYGSTQTWNSDAPRQVDLNGNSHAEFFALHARRLVVHHPKDASKIEIVAPFPSAWKNKLRDLSNLEELI